MSDLPSEQKEAEILSSGAEVPKKKAPTLYAIILFKIIKGSLFLALAIVVYTLSDNDLPAEFQRLMEILKVHPGNRFWEALATKVGKLTEVKMVWAAVGTSVYSLFALVEGIGMLFRVSWAGWLAIGESAFFVPIELVELTNRFTWYLFAVMIVNIIIVWYLYRNRERLFRHHHHHH